MSTSPALALAGVIVMVQVAQERECTAESCDVSAKTKQEGRDLDRAEREAKTALDPKKPDPAKALESVEVGLRVRPCHPWLLELKARALEEQQKLKEALDVYKKLAEVDLIGKSTGRYADFQKIQKNAARKLLVTLLITDQRANKVLVKVDQHQPSKDNQLLLDTGDKYTFELKIDGFISLIWKVEKLDDWPPTLPLPEVDELALPSPKVAANPVASSAFQKGVDEIRNARDVRSEVDWSKAMARFQTAIETVDDWSTRYNRGRCALELKRFAMAIRDLHIAAYAQDVHPAVARRARQLADDTIYKDKRLARARLDDLQGGETLTIASLDAAATRRATLVRLKPSDQHTERLLLAVAEAGDQPALEDSDADGNDAIEIEESKLYYVLLEPGRRWRVAVKKTGFVPFATVVESLPTGTDTAIPIRLETPPSDFDLHWRPTAIGLAAAGAGLAAIGAVLLGVAPTYSGEANQECMGVPKCQNAKVEATRNQNDLQWSGEALAAIGGAALATAGIMAAVHWGTKRSSASPQSQLDLRVRIAPRGVALEGRF